MSIRSLTVYRRGFTVVLTARRKPKPEDFDPRRMPMHGAMLGDFWGEDLPDDFMRFGVQFADGSKATNIERLAWLGSDEPAKTPIMMPTGGGGGVSYWIWPLPQPGQLRFVCEWPSEAIAEQHLELDAEAVLEASARVEPIWPARAR